MTGDHEVTFRPMTRDDFARLSTWLAAPHVARWWMEPADLEHIDREYGPHVDGTDPATELRIIELRGRPVGLIQRYRHRDHPEWDATVGVPDAVGIDYLIGDPDATGRGLGSTAIRLFAADTLATFHDAAFVCAVPQQANVASWRALEKAGFQRARAVDHLESDDPADAGPAYIYVLPRTPS